MSQIKDTTKALSERFKSELDVKDGGVIETPKGLYEDTLPEDLPISVVNRVMSHNESVVAAMTQATGEIGEEVLTKNKDLDSVTSNLKMGKFGTCDVTYNRSVVGPKSVSDRTEVTRYGVTQAKVRTFAGKNSGELKKVRDSLRERAENIFS